MPVKARHVGGTRHVATKEVTDFVFVCGGGVWGSKSPPLPHLRFASRFPFFPHREWEWSGMASGVASVCESAVQEEEVEGVGVEEKRSSGSAPPPPFVPPSQWRKVGEEQANGEVVVDFFVSAFPFPSFVAVPNDAGHTKST